MLTPGPTLAVVSVAIVAAAHAAVPSGDGAVAVLGLVSDNGAASPSSAPLATALTDEGVTVLSGTALRERLLGEGKPLAHALSQTVVEGIVAAGEAYDRGEFADSARRAAQAFEALSHAAPSLQRELSIQEAQLVWGAAALQLKGRAAALPHFRFALQRDPHLTLDKARFAPPVQRLLEDERSRIVAAPQATLTVAGAAGTKLFVDGIARGSLPLSLSMPPHRATVWAEAGGQAGLVHELDVLHSTWLSIDWQLEVAARFGAADWQVELPTSEALRRVLVQRLLTEAGASELLGLRWRNGATGAAARLEVVRFGSDGNELDRRMLPPEGIDWNRLARALREPKAASVQPVGAGVAAAKPLAVAATPKSGRFPWLTAGLVAGGAVVVTVVVVLALTLHPTNTVLVGPETPHP